MMITEDMVPLQYRIFTIEAILSIEQIRWIDKCEIGEFNFYGNELEKLLDYYTN